MHSINLYRQVRLMLIYDIPVGEEIERKNYSKFHKDIIRLGFHMLQYSVYTKVISNDTNMHQNISRVERILPKYGNVIAFKITEKQYQDMLYLRGEKNKADIIIGNKELVIFGGDDKLI